MKIDFLRCHLRLIGTIVLIVFSGIFYSLPFQTVEKPLSLRLDVLRDDDYASDIFFDIERFWGLSGPLTLLNSNEIEQLHGVVERIKYHNDIRRNKRLKMTRHLMTQHHLNEKDARILVRSADRVALKYQMDLELLLAIIFVESSYRPQATSNVGAIGLMQIVPKWHQDKINEYGDVNVLYDVQTNIEIGTAILVEYINKDQDLMAALQRYNGSRNDETKKYSNKIFNEYHGLMKMLYHENSQLLYQFDIVNN